MESENASSVIHDFVFLCRKIGSIEGYFCRYIIKHIMIYIHTYTISRMEMTTYIFVEKEENYFFIRHALIRAHQILYFNVINSFVYNFHGLIMDS